MCLFGFPACHDTPQRASIAFHLGSPSPPPRFLRHASRPMLLFVPEGALRVSAIINPYFPPLVSEWSAALTLYSLYFLSNHFHVFLA